MYVIPKKFLKKGGKVKTIPPGVRSDSQLLPVADDED